MKPAREAVLAAAPNAADAEHKLARLADAGVLRTEHSDDEIQLLTAACARAPYLVTLLARDPARLGRVAADPYLYREKPRSVFAAELAERIAGVSDGDELDAALRHYRGDEMVRLGAREFGLGTGVEVGRELARLAEVAFDEAIAFHRDALIERWGAPVCRDHTGEEVECELTVIGMGKLGGEELNFSSDVDVIYVYTSDDGAAGERSLHVWMSELCRRVTASIGETTADDTVFRVDLRLRPEGSRGAIANSLLSTERYYETWGRPWERQAWLKARPCAGSRALGADVMEMLEPFVHPRSTSPAVINEVTALNRKIKAELGSSGIDAGFDVKNGVGGIREIEFFVQALQLVHAGTRRELRARSTLATLDQLLFAGIITAAEQRALAAAYSFLRHVEHARQLESGRQTQRLPVDRTELGLLAQRVGFSDAEAFETAMRAHTATVAELFASLGHADDELPAEITLLMSADLPEQRTRDALAALGFRDPDQAARHLDYGRHKPASPLGPAATGAAARVAPQVLAEIAATPDPDQALLFLVDLISKRGSWSALWRLFDENREAMRMIASLMGTSAYLARVFVNHPELIDGLLLAGRASPRADRATIDERIDARFGNVDAGDDEQFWNQLAELKQAEVLRVGLADIAGELTSDAVCAELSTIADAVLQRSYSLVEHALVERHGVPRDERGEPARMAVLALGKLGGSELGYASDLDIVFVYEGDGHTDGPRAIDNSVFMTRLAQRLVSSLFTLHRGGRLYETDTRLRPEGSKGLLVSSLSGWLRYHREGARLWERQALIKLRPVAGDADLGRTVADNAAQHVYAGGRESRRDIAHEIRSMRERIQAELAGTSGAWDFKAGRGGLIDVEFAAQFLQLVHGGAHPSLRTRATIPALSAAAQAGVADADACAVLIDGYRFLRLLEHRVRIVHDRSDSRLPTDDVELDKLARRARYPDADALRAAYRQRTGLIRDAYERILGG